VHKLPARGVAEQSIVLPDRDALRAQLIEQAFVDTERPFFAPVRRAIFVVQIAEMVPEMFGERRFGNSARRKALADDWGTPGLCKGASCKRELRRGVTDRSFGPRFDRKWWRR
jgi:hypothetical protein